MLKHADKQCYLKGLVWLIAILSLLFISACSSYNDRKVDKLNTLSYAYHYRNLDSVSSLATKAIRLSDDYHAGKAEAYNNLAFVSIARMDYEQAYLLLDSVELLTDNQLELLIADIQLMRLCQRESKNKRFYDYREKAVRRFNRIAEELSSLSERMKMRYVYAKSEFAIVNSTYYYYVGLSKQSRDAIKLIDPTIELQKDTAQYLNYLYQIGSGGIIKEKSHAATVQKEFECLFKCYVLAKQCGMVYWEANALQSLSEHLLKNEDGKTLIQNNIPAFSYINKFGMPDSLLAGYMSQTALDLFTEYGDVYQTAGALRTLSHCYFALGDYESSLICLDDALTRNKVIEKAPDQVASIRESLTLVYAAMNDKNNSDINRNEYLDIQEATRQDRQLEARAEQLERTSVQLNMLIFFIVILIVAVVALLSFSKLRKKDKDAVYTDKLLEPLSRWKQEHEKKAEELDQRLDDAEEDLATVALQLDKAKRRSLDNKAKFFLVVNVVPYIDRIINEVKRIKSCDNADLRKGRLAYTAELTDKINEYNTVLTYWIQLQQGKVSLHIESFNLNDVFDVLAKSEMSFLLKGVEFHVEPTNACVKADKVLTLFMLNTLSDNARKFTDEGGKVVVSATKADDYVEVSVADTGIGLSAEELSSIFDRKVKNGHGFGLMNCRGIVEKYKKISKIFSVCGLFAESDKGSGSRFFFRLPYGVMRCVLSLAMLCTGLPIAASVNAQELLTKAGAFADSAYYSNIYGTYEKTLEFADSCRSYLNRHYKALQPDGREVMVEMSEDGAAPAEIIWFHENVKTDYEIILDIRNESAVAALALHEWDLYEYNNNVYKQLFKERSADSGLKDYCQAMQDSRTNKTIAVVLLVILLAAIVFAYYFLYYRRILYYRFCVDEIGNINNILLSDKEDEDKLSLISKIDTSRFPEDLRRIVAKITGTVNESVTMRTAKHRDIEMLEDELHKTTYETEKLYVGNSIIDNCLSALKHETMYYPSRIRQLVGDAGCDTDVDAVSEVVAYYKELYSILCEQVRRQTDSMTFECKPVSVKDITGTDVSVLGDRALLTYLFELLSKQFGFMCSAMSVSSTAGRYVTFEATGRTPGFTEERCKSLFCPSVDNIPYLICRQIVRESAGQTNLHGCGITVESSGGCAHVKVTLAQAERGLRNISGKYKNN